MASMLSCFNPDPPANLRCTNSGECPPGQTCGPDDVCRPDGELPPDGGFPPLRCEEWFATAFEPQSTALRTDGAWRCPV